MYVVCEACRFVWYHPMVENVGAGGKVSLLGFREGCGDGDRVMDW